MKVGGNAAALEYFTRNGGNAYLTPGTEGKVKYTSSTARSYKEELAKRVLEDAKGGAVTSRVAFPGLSLGSTVQSNVSVTEDAVGANGDDDFFDDWDKPAAAPTAPVAAPALTAAVLPSIGKQRPTVPAATSAPSSGVNTPERSSTPTTTSSRMLNANRSTSSASTATRKGALGATKVPSSTLGGSKKLGGVKKATAINFEEAERKAKLEEAKAQRMEEEALQEKEGFEQAEAMAKAAIQAATASQANHEAISVSNGNEPTSPIQPKSPARPTGKPRSSAEVERLGMGFGKLNMGAARVAAKQERAKPSNGANASSSIEEPNFARSKFAGQKSISSDQYFERGSYDANQTAEARERLQGFSGQTSISSNQYFGREEDEEDGGGRMGPSADGDDWAGDFEQTAREYYSKLMANPDVQSGIESFRAGAMKLSQYLEDMSRNGL